MTEAVDNAITKLTDALEAGIKAVGTLGEKYGPEVVEAGLAVVRINGAGNLLTGATCVAVCWLLFRLGRPIYTAGAKASAEYWKPSTPAGAPDGSGRMVLGLGLMVAGGAAGVVAFISLVNVWNYVAMFEPKLWVAKRLLGW